MFLIRPLLVREVKRSNELLYLLSSNLSLALKLLLWRALYDNFDIKWQSNLSKSIHRLKLNYL